MRDALAERGRAGENRQALLDASLTIVGDPAVPDEDVGALIRGERIGCERLRAAQATALWLRGLRRPDHSGLAGRG
jgi:hypothetical protein